MTKLEAAKILQNLMWTIQKARSNAMQGFEDSSDLVKSTVMSLTPWLFGKKCPLETLIKALDRYESTGELEGLFLYNMMIIVHQLEPGMLNAISAINGIEFPEPDVSWCSGLIEG